MSRVWRARGQGKGTLAVAAVLCYLSGSEMAMVIGKFLKDTAREVKWFASGMGWRKVSGVVSCLGAFLGRSDPSVVMCSVVVVLESEQGQVRKANGGDVR